MNTPEFLEYLSEHCLSKGYSFQSNYNTNNVRSFFLTKKKKKVKFTHKFDNTCLEDCQYTIFETSDLYITPLELSRKLLTKIDDSFLSKEGLKLKRIFKG